MNENYCTYWYGMYRVVSPIRQQVGIALGKLMNFKVICEESFAKRLLIDFSCASLRLVYNGNAGQVWSFKIGWCLKSIAINTLKKVAQFFK